MRPAGKDGLSREEITEARIEELARELAEAGAPLPILSRAEREASRRAILAELPAGAALWLFAYGSLMWNPAAHVAETRPALLRGWRREFCLWSPLGRGTPQRPGLTLALLPGGSCRGLALKLAPERVESESEVIWRREMLSGAYQPRWVALATDAGPLRAVTFVANPRHPGVARALPVETVVEVLASAEGRIGRCRDYLAKVVAELEAIGLARGPMHRLHSAVAGRQGARAE
jgi:cation transport protein ChaC